MIVFEKHKPDGGRAHSKETDIGESATVESWRVEPNSIRASGNSCRDANEGQPNDAYRFQRLGYLEAPKTASSVP